MPCRLALAARFLAATMLAIAVFHVGGCTKLHDVKSELGKGGFTMWYPPEEGVQPGEIWHISGTKKDIVHTKPASLIPRPADLKFITLTKDVNATAELNANIAKGLLGDAGALQAAFEAGTVRKVSLDFGDSKAYRLVVGQLKDPAILSTFTSEYRADFQKVKDRVPGWNLVVATVQTSGMKYTLDVTDRASFNASVEGALKGLLGADIDLSWLSNTRVELIIPDNKSLVIGAAPLRPEILADGFISLDEALDDDDYLRAVSGPLSIAPARP